MADIGARTHQHQRHALFVVDDDDGALDCVALHSAGAATGVEPLQQFLINTMNDVEADQHDACWGVKHGAESREETSFACSSFLTRDSARSSERWAWEFNGRLLGS